MASLNEKFDKKSSTLKKKHVTKLLELAANHVSSLSKHCNSCCAPFDPRAEGALDSWQVITGPLGTTLACPECFRKSSVCSTVDSQQPGS